MSRCNADKTCSMTMGYYLGGNQWICWFHALLDPFIFKVIKELKCEAFPKEDT